MEAAPLFTDVARAPEGGAAHWLTAEDGLRLRIGHWPAAPSSREGAGTVLIFPGRTEYIEKYGPAVAELTARGLACAVIDWRGQGLSDRLCADPLAGHVTDFAEYQRDVRAMLLAARELSLPRPWHLMAHSMGGCIGLRAMIEGMSVRSAVFSAPMWGIQLDPYVRPVAWGLGWLNTGLGRADRVAVRTKTEKYVIDTAFENNLLTSDLQMYAFMRHQLEEHPELALGGPSFGWGYAALRECRRLRLLPAPDVPALTFLGSNERLVDMGAIRSRMADWPGGELVEMPGAEHEIIMEAPDRRQLFFDRATAHFALYG
ncbi:lysophospholipase [Brevirhabdus pacifica]|uniref:Lysophospholipase n=1 Tax=Brevirhabdus pacifica TaxID=1267768 RepID=A0A1U7DMB4_9RHOB|nr:lysophospholipase [Brevirhabdus pacifica]OWU78838.1 hydrolase [Loktanella sp. 22II-4b]